MSNTEEHYQDADRVARAVEEENRRRRDTREMEMGRLRRLHAEEAADDRALSRYARTMRAIRRHQMGQTPERVRRSLVRLTAMFVVISVVGPMLTAVFVADLTAQQGVPRWVGLTLAAVYVLSFSGALAWHARACWSNGGRSRASTAVAWALLLLPVPVLLVAAVAGWATWVGVLVILVVLFILATPGIGMSCELPLQYEQIRSAKKLDDESK
ncbi:hypothetical protein [Streptomyces sp. NPDC000931]|uniref:hypothetical protein n=1 Tax=Streptomyces sp. NPDC000931 TaxID=3154372 RepID=UPI0033272235